MNLSSDGSGTSGAGTTSLSGQTITVNGTVYRLAGGQLDQHADQPGQRPRGQRLRDFGPEH